MNLIISYNFIQSIVALEYRTTFDTSQYKFLVATNGLILYVVSWQATRSILPPLYRPFFSSVQTRRAPHRCWSWKNSTVTKAGINFSPPCNLCIHVCICKTLSLSLTWSNANTYEARLSFIPNGEDVFHEKFQNILTVYNLALSLLSLSWKTVSRRSINCHSIGRKYDAWCWWKSIL